MVLLGAPAGSRPPARGQVSSCPCFQRCAGVSCDGDSGAMASGDHTSAPKEGALSLETSCFAHFLSALQTKAQNPDPSTGPGDLPGPEEEGHVR